MLAACAGGLAVCVVDNLSGVHTPRKIGPDTAVTALSGGQSRALKIADVACLSASPIVLIDEIENAGVDRRQALDLLVKKEKIVLVATHDPLLALSGSRRGVIRNGGMVAVLETSADERVVLGQPEETDALMASLRRRMRQGERLEAEAGGEETGGMSPESMASISVDQVTDGYSRQAAIENVSLHVAPGEGISRKENGRYDADRHAFENVSGIVVGTRRLSPFSFRSGPMTRRCIPSNEAIGGGTKGSEMPLPSRREEKQIAQDQ